MELDAQQSPVVDHEAGPLLVIAGAGSGKTLTITARTARRLRAGADPARTVMVTFTNKAAREMSIRLAGMLDVPEDSPQMPWVGTQHGFGMRLLRRYHHDLGLRHFSLMSPDDAYAQQVRILQEAGVDEGSLDDCLRSIEWLGNEGVLPAPAPWADCGDGGFVPDLSVLGEAAVPGAWKRVDQSTVHAARERFALWKRAHGLVDVDDLILLPIMLVSGKADLRERLGKYFEEILVDEAQDLNGAQNRLWRLLCSVEAGPRMVMVGDDDQSIYRWRDARPEHLREFSRTATMLRLETNYRSHALIVDHAHALICNNTERLPKNPRAASREPGSLLLRVHEDGTSMALSICEDIAGRLEENPATRIAILYRTHRMAKLLEPHLVRHRINYHIKNGTAFLERNEPRLVLAIARLASNPLDTPAFARVAEMLPGMGAKSVATVCATAEGPLSAEAIAALPARAARSLEQFVADMDKLRVNGPLTLSQWLGGYEPFWAHLDKRATARGKKALEKPGRLRADGDPVEKEQRASRARVDLILNIIRDSVHGGIKKDPEDDPWSLALDILHSGPKDPEDEFGQTSDEGTAPVIVGTIHGAKGLEWDEVHIAGFSEGLMPLSDAEGNIGNLEEERCLAYVALTRGKHRVVVHHTPYPMLPGIEDRKFKISPFAVESGLPREGEAGLAAAKRAARGAGAPWANPSRRPF